MPADCGRCRSWPPGLTAVAATRYGGAAEATIRALKYSGWRHLAWTCAGAMAAALATRGASPHVLVPVPLHPARQRARGFNQARLLADALAERLERPVTDALVRVRPTPPQVGRGRARRAVNVRDAFVAAGVPAGSTIGLVDDVATSGATLAAAARPLLAGGAGAVVGVTFALALDSPFR